MGTLYRISSAKKLQQLTKVSGKFCKIFKTYAGKIGEEVQRSVKMQPGCPIPKVCFFKKKKIERAIIKFCYF